MPFDPCIEEDLSYATGFEGLRRLSKILRNFHEAGRAGFEWDFSFCMAPVKDCGTAGCALGLASLAWPEFRAKVGSKVPDRDSPDVPYFEAADEIFGLPRYEITSMFGGALCNDLNLTHAQVTPLHVADAIDKFLEIKNFQG